MNKYSESLASNDPPEIAPLRPAPSEATKTPTPWTPPANMVALEEAGDVIETFNPHKPFIRQVGEEERERVFGAPRWYPVYRPCHENGEWLDV